MPEAFNIDLESLTEEEYHNYLVRWYAYYLKLINYQPEYIKAMKQVLETYEGETK